MTALMQVVFAILVSLNAIHSVNANQSTAPTAWPCDFSAVLIPSASRSLSADSKNCKCLPGFAGTGTACSQCAAGTYQAVLGQSGCTACAAGTYSTSTGATAQSTCVGCNGTSFYSSSSGSTACLPCRICSSTQYMQSSCGPTANAQCAECTSCKESQFVYKSCSRTSDTVCDENAEV